MTPDNSASLVHPTQVGFSSCIALPALCGSFLLHLDTDHYEASSSCWSVVEIIPHFCSPLRESELLLAGGAL